MDESLRTGIGRQFGAAIDMLDNAIRACPDALWREPLWDTGPEPSEFAQFWYLAYHTLFWLDLYLSCAVEEFVPPAPFTLAELDPAGLLPERVYSRDELLAYLDHGRRKCRATIDALADERAGRLCSFSWGEVSFMELLLDNMRHVQEHAAQLSLLLGQKAGWSPRWVSGVDRRAAQLDQAALGASQNGHFQVRPFDKSDLDRVVDLSLLAWEPVFTAWQRILGPDLYPVAIYADWRKGQQEVVERFCNDEIMNTWVAEVDEQVVGFVVYELNHEKRIGEVQLLAVHPERQNRGIGAELNQFALQKFREAGMKLAVVGTGGDEGHAPARRCYEKVGYTGLPAVHYYQLL